MMKQSLFGIALCVVLVCCMGYPTQLFAAGFVPCGLSSGTAEEMAPCTLCHIIVGGKIVMDWGIKVMVAIGLVVITAMGIWYIVSTGNDGMLKQAKSGIFSTLIGIAVILGAWLIVNTTLLLFAQEADPTKNPIRGLVVANGFQFSCSTLSLAGSGRPGTGATGGGSTGGGGGAVGGGAPCTDPDALKAALKAGGTVCAGGSFSCPKSCDTSAWNAQINAAAARYGVAASSISLVIAKESSCSPNAIGRDTGDCGLMQVKPSTVGNSTCVGPSFNLLDPATNIDQGTKILAGYLATATTLLPKYGATVTQKMLAAAIYNGGPGESAPSVSCKVGDGWPVIPKWGCPIDPGTAKYNACAIRQYACSLAACP